MIQLDLRSRTKNPTPTPSVVKNPTPPEHLRLRHPGVKQEFKSYFVQSNHAVNYYLKKITNQPRYTD